MRDPVTYRKGAWEEAASERTRRTIRHWPQKPPKAKVS